MAQNRTYYSFAKWFRRCSLIIILAPIAYIICCALLLSFEEGTLNYDNTQKAIEIILWINFISGILWLILAVIMFFTAGTVRGTGASPIGIRVGILIALTLVLAELILTILFKYHSDWTEKTWVHWVGVFMPLINVVGYIVGAHLGKKVMHQLAD